MGSNLQRVSKLMKFESEFDWNGIEFPVSLKNIRNFEINNQISVNVLAEENGQIYICRKGAHSHNRVANPMLITDGNIKHYIAIKSLSRLLSSRNNKSKETQHFCMNCLQSYPSELSRDEHSRYCDNNEAVHIEMPRKHPIIKYTDGQYQLQVPFIMYANFKSILEPISRPSNNPEMPSTQGVNIHTPSGWCIRSEFAYGRIENPTTLYRGPECVKKFCEHIIEEAHRLYRSFPEKPMEPLTESQVKSHNRAKTCHVCFEPFKNDPRYCKVRDHCHYSGKYRGSAHSLCSLQYKIPSYIPIVFHNLTGYDAHLFIRELSSYGSQVGIIAKNMEDYISFSIKVEVDKYFDKNSEERSKEIDLRFIDSIKFMSSIRDSLVNNLESSNYKFFRFKEYNKEQHALL